jgi:hypothetical protein
MLDVLVSLRILHVVGVKKDNAIQVQVQDNVMKTFK